MAEAEKILQELGYSASEEHQNALQADANDPATGEGSLSHNGEYRVLGAWTKGDITVHLEQNTAPEEDGELKSQVTHPPVYVISKGEDRVVTVMQRDPDALKAVLSELG